MAGQRDNIVSNKLGAPGNLVERITGTNDDTFDSFSYTRTATPYPVNSTREVRAFEVSERFGYNGTGGGKLDNELLDLLVLNPPALLDDELAVEGATTGKYLRKMAMSYDVDIDESPGQYGLTLAMFSSGVISEAAIA